jgi:excisionase family DNA binding protein
VDAIQILLEWHGLMTVADAARFLRTSPGNLRKLLGAGTFKGFRVHGEWRINPSDLVAYLHEHRNF